MNEIGCASVHAPRAEAAAPKGSRMGSIARALARLALTIGCLAGEHALAAPVATISYVGPAVAIPDNTPTGVNIQLTVANVGRIADLDFRFDTGGACDATIGNTNAGVTHTFVGDLTFRLTSPTGTSTTFWVRRGGTRENICATTVNDEGGFPNLSTITSTTGSFVAGSFSPEPTGLLSAFEGENANGTWVLNVSDNSGVDTGSLRRFSLLIDPDTSKISGTFGPGAPSTTMVSRPLRPGLPTVQCGQASAFPGTVTNSVYQYRAHTFKAGGESLVCTDFGFRVLDATCAHDLQLSVYRGAFVPSNLAQNYVGDAGVSTGGAPQPTAFSASLIGGEKIVAVVFATTAGSDDTCDYEITVPEPEAGGMAIAAFVALAALARRSERPKT